MSLLTKTSRRVWVLGAALALPPSLWALAAHGTSEAGPAAASTAKRTTAIMLSPVRRAPVTRTVHAAGLLEATHELELAFKVGGVVREVRVDDGERVRKGQVLAVVDPTEVRAGASQAEQGVAKAERDLLRAETLHRDRGASQAVLDDAQTALRVARAQAAGAAFNLRHTVLIAPENGVIDRRAIEVGEVVAPGRPVFHMSSRDDAMVVRTSLTDRDALALTLQQSARVVLDARPETVFSGHVARIASAASPGTGTFEVEIALDGNTAAALPVGLTAKIELDFVTRAAVSIPVRALIDGEGDRAAVFVLEDGRPRRKPVRVAFIQGEEAVLREGLEGVADVVSSGAEKITDDAPVRVVR